MAMEANMHDQITKNDRILRIKEVKMRTGLSTSTIYKLIKKGLFPRQTSLGARCVGWLESTIDAWLKGRRNWACA